MSGPRDVPRIKGQLLVARMEFLGEQHGPVGIAKVMASVPEEDRRLLEGVERDGWYPFATLAVLDLAIARCLAPGDPEVFERLGEASARHRTEWLGEHASLVSPHAFLFRAAEEHGRFHSFGRAAYRRTGFTEGELNYSEYPEVHRTFCRASVGYFRRVVELLTRGPARVEERRCQAWGDEACVFWISWDHHKPPE